MIQALGLALGAAWTSGINLYATVAVLGLMQRFGFAHLPGGLDVLSNWWIIGIALGLYVVEFVADKVPYVDTVWDAVHTFIRVPAGALLAAAGTAHLDTKIQVVALLLGGGTALSTHGAKATARAAVNTVPEPFTNWTLSIVGDILAISATILAVWHPIFILIVIVISLALLAWITPKILRRLRRLFIATRNLFSNRSLSTGAAHK